MACMHIVLNSYYNLIDQPKTEVFDQDPNTRHKTWKQRWSTLDAFTNQLAECQPDKALLLVARTWPSHPHSCKASFSILVGSILFKKDYDKQKCWLPLPVPPRKRQPAHLKSSMPSNQARHRHHTMPAHHTMLACRCTGKDAKWSGHCNVNASSTSSVIWDNIA